MRNPPPLLLLAFSGLCVLSANIREYHYVNSSETWAEAQRYCRKMFTDLATVDNKEDNKRLLGVLQDHGEYAWIGLYDHGWKWALRSRSFNQSSDFSKWKFGVPERSSCVAMSSTGFWRDLSCNRKRSFVCFYEKGPSVYILVEEKLSWYSAKNYCRSFYTDLASVRNVSENNNISSLLSAITWIGLRANGWSQWSDKTPTTFTKWNDNQPGNRYNRKSCAAVNATTGTWWSADCEAKHHFICQNVTKIVRHKTTCKLTFRSEADLKDPDVQQQLLEQLHAKLKGHGLPDVKLRWIQTDGQTFHKEHKK